MAALNHSSIIWYACALVGISLLREVHQQYTFIGPKHGGRPSPFAMQRGVVQHT